MTEQPNAWGLVHHCLALMAVRIIHKLSERIGLAHCNRALRCTAGVSEAGIAKETEALLPRTSAKLATNASAIMDPDYMTMMLAMDTLWASEDIQDPPPTEAPALPSEGAA